MPTPLALQLCLYSYSSTALFPAAVNDLVSRRDSPRVLAWQERRGSGGGQRLLCAEWKRWSGALTSMHRSPVPLQPLRRSQEWAGDPRPKLRDLEQVRGGVPAEPRPHDQLRPPDRGHTAGGVHPGCHGIPGSRVLWEGWPAALLPGLRHGCLLNIPQEGHESPNEPEARKSIGEKLVHGLGKSPCRGIAAASPEMAGSM